MLALPFSVSMTAPPVLLGVSVKWGRKKEPERDIY